MDFEWVTSRPEHPKVAMDEVRRGSKGLQLEIAARVVLYVRGIGWDVSSLLIFSYASSSRLYPGQ